MTEDVEKDIIDAMDMSICSYERKTIKKLFEDPTEPHVPRRTLQELKDGLILTVHERNCIEHRKGKRSADEYEKHCLCDGVIRGILFALGYDVRL